MKKLKYGFSIKINGNEIELIRTDARYNSTFPASAYPDMVSFYDAIYKADHSKIVFVKERE